MEKIKLTVEGMACSHCAAAVEKAVGAVDGVSSVSVDLAAKTADVCYDPAKADIAAIKAAITGQGYDVIG